MSTRTDVLAEFTRGTVTRYFDTDAMAEEIVRLRSQLAEEKEAFACPSCADLLSDEDAADYYDEDEMGER